MTRTLTLLFATLLSHTVFASAPAQQPLPVVETIQTTFCTRDFNPWGKASHCSCPDEAQYERRLGQCLVGQTQELTVEGSIQTGVMAIGGETTGFLLQDETNTYELVLSFEQQDQVSALEAEGLNYRVNGDVLVVPAVEFGQRTLLLVDTIEALPAL